MLSFFIFLDAISIPIVPNCLLSKMSFHMWSLTAYLSAKPIDIYELLIAQGILVCNPLGRVRASSGIKTKQAGQTTLSVLPVGTTSGLYYKNITLVNDASRVVS